MKEVFEKITDRLVKKIKPLHNANWNVAMEEAIEIVNQVAEEYKDRIFINGQCCWQSCACTEKCQECNRYTLSNSDIDWYESIEDWNDEYGKDTNVRTNADHIRSLTDEELANTLIHFDFCDICSSCHAAEDCMCTNEEEKEKVVKWLQELKGE